MRTYCVRGCLMGHNQMVQILGPLHIVNTGYNQAIGVEDVFQDVQNGTPASL